MLHACEADEHGRPVRDMRERVNIGDVLQLFVKTIDAQNSKFNLSARDPARPSREATMRRVAASPAGGPSAAASAAMAAAAERERRAEAAREAAREAREAERRELEAAKAALEEMEMIMIEEAKAREEAAKAAREAAGLVLPAAELIKGRVLPPVEAPSEPLEVLVTVVVRGKQRSLYKMPWKD